MPYARLTSVVGRGWVEKTASGNWLAKRSLESWSGEFQRYEIMDRRFKSALNEYAGRSNNS